jgi:hypothetical protein
VFLVIRRNQSAGGRGQRATGSDLALPWNRHGMRVRSVMSRNGNIAL